VTKVKIVLLVIVLVISHSIVYVEGQSSIRQHVAVVDIWNGVPNGSRGGIMSKGFYGKCATVGDAVYLKVQSMIDGCYCSSCNAERINTRIIDMTRKPIDWSKPLEIVTNRGTFKVSFIGRDFRCDKNVVRIEHVNCTTYPDYYTPDENGYVVEFDTYITNQGEGLPMNFKFPFSQMKEWAKCCDALREQGFLIIKP